MIYASNELKAEQQAFAGSKGSVLARLYQSGYPVPEGFVILPAAFADDDLLPASWSQVQAHLERMRRAAAIVARELGIPAVVGCNDATMRLHTGDRVRVDGGQGTVEILGS